MTDFEKNIYSFTKEIEKFEYRMDSLDHLWDILFPDQKNKWHKLRITKYKGVFYCIDISGPRCTLAVTPNKSVEVENTFSSSFPYDGRDNPEFVWNEVISDARIWFKAVHKNWIRANQKVQTEYPLHMRQGKVPHSLIRASNHDFYRLDKELGKAKMKKFIKLVEELKFSKSGHGIRESMTAKDFFDYCKIAYIAAKEKDEKIDENLSGREMYKKYAYSWDVGLLEIDENSSQEYADWVDHKHPKCHLGSKHWRIKRGGSATCISLFVTRPDYQKEGFKIALQGEWLLRLRETICMVLAICEAGLPITILNPEAIRKRLLAQDNIGIVPSYELYSRANWHFNEKDSVYDTLHLKDLGRYKRRILPFISWEPLPIFKPV